MIPVIPDKIYVGIQDLGSGYVYNLSLDNNGEQEYIRKDALLEWARVHIQDFESEFQQGQNYAFQQVIDKINSL